MKTRFNIFLIFVFTLFFTVESVAQDTIKRTWLSDRIPGRCARVQPESLTIPAINGKEFTVNWSDGSIKTMADEHDDIYTDKHTHHR